MAPARLKLAFFADTFDGVKTGAVVSAQRVVAALRERHEVRVVGAGPPEAAGEGRIILPGFYLPGFRHVMQQMGFIFAAPRRRVLEDVVRWADVVHVQFPFWLDIRAVGLARRLGTPVVAAFHVQPENLFLNVGIRSRWLTDWTYRFFLWSVFNRADAVVCPSAFALGELRRRGLRVPAEVVSNGISGEFHPASLERFERHRGKFLVLSVGRLAREKRHDVILEGVRRSRYADRIQLVITGRGPEGERVARGGAALPVPAEVSFVSDEDLRRLLVTADLLVHASEVELEGMAVLEALGCGTPALIADSPGSAARDLAVSPDLLFRSGDPDDLARRIDALIERPERLRAARTRCLELAPRYAFDGCVRKLESAYLRLAGAARLRSAT